MAGAYVSTQSGNDADTTIDCGTSGTDRIMVFGIGVEDTAVDTLSGITVDGKSCTYRGFVENTGGDGSYMELWDIDEATLGASAGAVTLAISGVTVFPNDWGYHCRLFTGMNAFVNYWTATAGDTTGIDVTLVDNAVDDLVIMFDFTAYDGSVTSSATSPLGTLLDDGDGHIDPYSADLGSCHGFETSANTDKTWNMTWNESTLRHAAIVGVYSVSGLTRTLASARIYDDAGAALAAQNATAEEEVTTPFRTVAGVQMVGDTPAESMEWRYRVVGDPDDAIESVDT